MRAACRAVIALVGTSGGAVVPVLELADLRVDEAFDAAGRGAGVIRFAAARGFEGRDGVHRWWWEPILVGVPAGVEVPAKVGARDEQEKYDQEDYAAVHCAGLSVVNWEVRLGVRIRGCL